MLLLSVLIGLAGNLDALGANQPVQTKSVEQAAIEGDVAQIKMHIAKGSNFKAMDQYGYTPLTRAIEGHHPEAAKLIIESDKADINSKDRAGKTPLMIAIASVAKPEEMSVALALVAKGADVKAKNAYDQTALHIAIQTGQREIAEALIAKGVDVSGADKSGQTPLSLAMQRNDAEMADLLKKHGAKEPVMNASSPYGDYAYGGNPGAPQGPGAAAPSRRAEIQIDPNAIRAEIKAFEGLAAALKAVDDKSEAEQQAWIQRRIDNRIALLGAVEKQFSDEMAFIKAMTAGGSDASGSVWKGFADAIVKQGAAPAKAEKTAKAIDDLNAKRKKLSDQIGPQLRDQRRTTLTQNQQTNAVGGARSGVRGGRGRSATTGTAGSPGYSASGPYGAAGARTPQRRGPADAGQPVVDQETQGQIQAWLNAKPEDKTSLLEAVHQMNLADLDDLRQVAVEEQSKKAAAAVSGLMLAHEERVQKITKKWQDDDERQLKLQERYGTQGMPGRGTPGTQQQQNQPGMRGGRRGR